MRSSCPRESCTSRPMSIAPSSVACRTSCRFPGRSGTCAANAPQHGRGRCCTNSHRLGEPICHGNRGPGWHADPCRFGLHAAQARRSHRQVHGCGELRAGNGQIHMDSNRQFLAGPVAQEHSWLHSRWNKPSCVDCGAVLAFPRITSPAMPAITTCQASSIVANWLTLRGCR